MIEMFSSILGIVVTASSIAIAIIKSIKAGKKQNIVEYAKIVKKIPDFIIEAEQVLGEKQGAAKLQYVLNQCHIECLQKKVEFIKKDLEFEIEKILKTPQKKEN